MGLRDETESVLRAWNAHEQGRGADPIIDFDCHPYYGEIQPAASRLTVYQRLQELHRHAEESGDAALALRIGADIACLAAFMGERRPLSEYVLATQGCPAAGWPAAYVEERGEIARQSLGLLGIGWGPETLADMWAAEGRISADEAAAAIRESVARYEPAVREATGTGAPYELSIETTDVDAYWSFWLDGAGDKIRLRLNLRDAKYTVADGRQFALHEVLGHGLQNASFTAHAARENVPWVRLTSVHALHQVLLEGLAQALPLFIAPGDEQLTARVRLAHYSQLVRAELHIAINSGVAIQACAAHARRRVPWWTDAQISNYLADRAVNPRLRSYLWAYPAGLDWFAALADSGAAVAPDVLRAAYRAPLTPFDLAALWPEGPPIGGPGNPVDLRAAHQA